MDQRPDVSLKKTARPSKFLALIALAIAFALPFILVKSFPHKQKANYDSKLPLELIEQQEIQANLPSPLTKRESATDVNSHSSVATLIGRQKPIVKQAPAVVKPVNALEEKSINHDKNELKTIITKKGDSLASIFSRLGLSRQTLQTILRENPHAKALIRLQTGLNLQFFINNNELEKLIAPFSNTEYVVIYREKNHYKSKVKLYEVTSTNHYITATVRGSLYKTAKQHNIPYKLMQQMAEIFAWDMNFAKDVRTGDQFTIIYKALFVANKPVGTGNIVAVSYKTRSRTLQAVLHTSRNGNSDYYSPQGASLKNAFNRYPLRFSHISSTFSLSRYHPILRYRRAHKGVDLAAPIGTPIFATGDGRIAIIGRQSGYGNMIKIIHNNIYSTIYGHMLKFQKGLSKGTFVKRGQIIGYVGQTGLASGPHCHYEFHIHRQPKNPTTVKLPRGNSVPANEMASFRSNTQTLLAELKLHESNHFATAQKRLG